MLKSHSFEKKGSSNVLIRKINILKFSVKGNSSVVEFYIKIQTKEPLKVTDGIFLLTVYYGQ